MVQTRDATPLTGASLLYGCPHSSETLESLVIQGSAAL